MDLELVVSRRRMVRNFQPTPLRPADVDRLVGTALRGPSAGFTQGLDLLVLEGPAQTGRYWDATLPEPRRAGFAWPGLLHAPLLIVFFAHPQAYAERYAEPDKGQGAPFPVPWWHVDAAFGAMLVLLAAVDLGLGALFFRTHRPPAVRAAFGVPTDYEPTGTVAVGHPAPGRPSSSQSRPRRPLTDATHHGHW